MVSDFNLSRFGLALVIDFLGSLPTGVWFLLIFAFLSSLSAFAYFLGAEMGHERGFILGYARGKLVGNQETNYLHASYRRDGETNA